MLAERRGRGGYARDGTIRPSTGGFTATNELRNSTSFFSFHVVGASADPFRVTVLLLPCQEFKEPPNPLFSPPIKVNLCSGEWQRRRPTSLLFHPPRPFSLTPGRPVTCAPLPSQQRPLPSQAPFFYSLSGLLDNNVPTRGPVTVTGRQQDNVVMDVAGEGSCLIWGGAPFAPSSSRQHSGTCGKLPRRLLGVGIKPTKASWMGFPKTLTLQLTPRNGFSFTQRRFKKFCFESRPATQQYRVTSCSTLDCLHWGGRG